MHFRTLTRDRLPQMGWSTQQSKNPAGDDATSPYRDAARGRRLQRVLAEGGVASRRKCEALIEGGKVKVNGTVVDFLPAWVDPIQDRIAVEGHRLNLHEPTVVVMYYKPRDVVCTTADPEGRRCVTDIVEHPSGVHILPVGRLDMESQGLLLLTNDRKLLQQLTHPSHGVPKVYEVTVRGQMEPETLAKLRKGVYLSDVHSRHDTRKRAKRAQMKSVEIIHASRDRTRLRLVLDEGRNRQVRRMFSHVGHPVKRLLRVEVGPLRLKGLRPGQWRDLLPTEITALRRAVQE